MKLIRTTNGCYLNADAITRIIFPNLKEDFSSCIMVKMSDCENELFCIGEYNGECVDDVLDRCRAREVLLDFLASSNDGTLDISDNICLKEELKRFPQAD